MCLATWFARYVRTFICTASKQHMDGLVVKSATWLVMRTYAKEAPNNTHMSSRPCSSRLHHSCTVIFVPNAPRPTSMPHALTLHGAVARWSADEVSEAGTQKRDHMAGPLFRKQFRYHGHAWCAASERDPRAFYRLHTPGTALGGSPVHGQHFLSLLGKVFLVDGGKRFTFN